MKSLVYETLTLDDVAQHVISHINRTIKYNQSCSPTVAGFSWKIARELVGNKNFSPINGMRRLEAGKHINYPAWTGRVWIRYSSSIKTFGSDPFSGSLTYTGTGGFGHYQGPWYNIYQHWYSHKRHNKTVPYIEPQIYSWDYRFFESDFPDLEVGRAFDMLSGKVTNRHDFLWEDPENVQADCEFLKNDIKWI